MQNFTAKNIRRINIASKIMKINYLMNFMKEISGDF